MKHTTKCSFAQLGTFLVLLPMLSLALLSALPDSQAGWITCPPRLALLAAGSDKRGPCQRKRLSWRSRWQNGWRYLRRSWTAVLGRSLLLGLLWASSGRRGPAWLLLGPGLWWLWQGLLVAYPELGQQIVWRALGWLLWQGQRGLLIGYLLLGLDLWKEEMSSWNLAEPRWSLERQHLPALGLGCAICGREEPWVEVQAQEEGGYQVEFCGHFQMAISGDDLFRQRLFMLMLRAWEVPGPQRGSRRTRDGRTPFVRQVQLAEWFGLPHPCVSRLERDWLRGDWANLLSQRLPEEVLTADLIERIVTVCATFPHWNREEVYEHLHWQGLGVSQRQVRQAMQDSGWTKLRQELRQRQGWTRQRFSGSEKWLLQELLQQNQALLEHLEQGKALPSEQRVALEDLQTLGQELGLTEKPPLPTRPWLLRVQRVLFGHWEEVTDESIRCPQCGTDNIGRKSRKPRLKKFYDPEGNLQELEVFRYYCRNRDCPRKSFTHFPPGLVPYSRHRLEVHVLALQAYSWSYSTYRRVGQTLQVSEMTVYRWVSAWGQELLPVAAVFGLVRSSGVVGVDEKYVLVPKNDKPAGKNRRWMYVYLAVDAHTYDLLHIAIYAHNTKESAQAFLLALRAKGYKPQVLVTDLRRDYGPVVAQVFPKARHHECIFHAEQEIGRYLRETWGRDYAQKHPQVEEMRQAVIAIFQARTKRTAQKRYQALLARQAEGVQKEPQLQWVYDFLEQHWPALVNAVESKIIPRTNNAVEMVIRRFDQHYQNFCGFESIQTARVYLGVFEKIYRFTPFSDDAQPAIRGRSPLEIAGYDLSEMPMPWLCRGYSLEWPVKAEVADVPSS